MRLYILILVFIFFSLYAYRNWFRSLCAMILLMAFTEHPDMPKSIMNIQGLNLWNILLANVVLAWLISRRHEKLVWDMPRHINIFLLLYLLIILIGFFRAIVDPIYLDENFTTTSMISEELINTLKWVIPGLLLYDGCRDRRRLMLGIISIMGIYVLLSIQVIRWVPTRYALSGRDLEARSRKIIQVEIGYSRVNMSMVLSGASWGTLSLLPLAATRRRKFMIIGLFFMISYAQALTGGRMGYMTWGVIGLIMCLLRWRKYLLLIPLFVIFVTFFFPGVVQRTLTGFGAVSAGGKQFVNTYEVTAGRNLIWPYVVDKITLEPLIGYGRLAMVRTGLKDYLIIQLGEPFPHPHNAYLELLLDNGLIGFFIIIPFFVILLVYCLQLFFDDSSPLYVAVGGMTLSLILALLVAGFGSQTFYPREGAVGMWASIGLMLRLVVERIKLQARVTRSSALSSLALPTRQYAHT